MAKNEVNLVPLALLLLGAYLLSIQNPAGWFLIVLGIYVLLKR